MTASETKGFALPAVPRPPLLRAWGGDRPAEPRGRDPNARGSEIIIKSEARDSVSGFQCNEAEETASRRPKGCSEDYSHSRHDFRDRRKERKRKRTRKVKSCPRQMLRAH